MQNNKQSFYGQARIFGAATFIILSLLTGPLAGYLLGAYLVVRFSWPQYVVLVCIGLGFIFAVYEIIKIAKFLLKKEEK